MVHAKKNFQVIPKDPHKCTLANKALFRTMHIDLAKLITFLFNPLIIWFSFWRKPSFIFLCTATLNQENCQWQNKHHNASCKVSKILVGALYRSISVLRVTTFRYLNINKTVMQTTLEKKTNLFN